MRVNLGSYPSQNKRYSVRFEDLSGGLNLQELDYRLKNNESPEMKNLWWEDGLLGSRHGQSWFTENSSYGFGYSCYSEEFHGFSFYHVGGVIACLRLSAPKPRRLNALHSGVSGNRGTWFRYQDSLFYKNKGGFYRIASHNGQWFDVFNVADEAYVPITIINADPDYGSGDTYQPANRLTGKRTVWYNAKADKKEYRIMADDLISVDRVTVSGEEVEFTADISAKTVTFKKAPPVTDPATNNTVAITFTVENTDAFKAIMDCEYAMVSGADQNLCILLAGCDAQPNAVFWNSNDQLSMNPSYWPMPYYNLVGSTEDAVTGFGRQYSDTIVLKEHSVGKLNFGVEKLDGRDSISFSYTNVNDRIGCDLPWSIQLIENNLVWCNTYRGVHIMRSSSAAYENNVECISSKVEGSGTTGLLYDVRTGWSVTSFDDDKRYWLCANGHVYLWDYSVSTYSDPSWFFFTNVEGVAYHRDAERNVYHLNGLGRVTKFGVSYSDYGGAIDKVYRFPTQHFGSYDRLKDIESVLFSVRSDTDAGIQIYYSSDYEIDRPDAHPISSLSWRLVPRNLSFRCLSTPRYAHVVRRSPGCRHIRHFTIKLSNNVVGCDLSIASAEIFYRFQGKER